ncbi:MAG: PHP-associated domain-containing protein [Eubacteriales bacterium]|nr:PHP-associated domain-containing protein [Eubacteriales bacterium]
MNYLYELHLHTAETSKCGQSSAADMIKALADKGISGTVVTDHFVNANARVDRDAPWHEQIDQILEGYRQAVIAGQTYGVQVFLGWEYFADWKDYVTFGPDESFLYEHPELAALDPLSYSRLIHEHGGFIIHAHPYREAWYTPEEKWGVIVPGAHDAIEVFNGGNSEERFNQSAFQYAADRRELMTAGSDTHAVETTGSGLMAFPRRLDSVQDLICALRADEGQRLIRPELPLSANSC